MVRNVLGSLIALIGATAAVWSPFRAWYDGRHGSDVRIEDLFNGITRSGAELFGSVFLPMAFAALLTLIGIVLRSRVLVTVAGLVVLGFTILWMVRQGQRSGELTTGTGGGGLGIGVALALGGGLLLLLGALVMRGRAHRARDRGDDRRSARGRDDAREPYPATAPEPWDPGRPAAQEWNPEPYAPGPAPAPVHDGSGEAPTPPDPGFPAVGGAHAGQDPSPDSWPAEPQQPQPAHETQPIPRAQPPQPPPQQDDRPPQQPPPRPAHPQSPTPPVEWGKEHRQTGPQPPGENPQQPPGERE